MPRTVTQGGSFRYLRKQAQRSSFVYALSQGDGALPYAFTFNGLAFTFGDVAFTYGAA